MSRPDLITMGRLTALVAALLCWAVQAHAGSWVVASGQSQVSFSTVKNGTVVETHRFSGLTGQVDDTGKAAITIDLASVDTGIAIRDQRMRDWLFEVGAFPTAVISAQLDLTAVRSTAINATWSTTLAANLSLHGQSQPVALQVQVQRMGADLWQVTSAQNAVVDGTNFGFGAGLEKLRQIAGLKSIAPAVSVSFSILLRAAATGG